MSENAIRQRTVNAFQAGLALGGLFVLSLFLLLGALTSCRIGDYAIEPRIGASYVDAESEAGSLEVDSEAVHYGVWFRARNLVQINEHRGPLPSQIDPIKP